MDNADLINAILEVSSSTKTVESQLTSINQALGIVMASVIVNAKMNPYEAIKFKQAYMHELVDHIDFYTARALIEGARP